MPLKHLDIGIIGAGIAGLGAAAALRKAGHDIELFERSHFNHEVGAAIMMTPNATHVLERLGFSFEKAQATECLQIRMLNGINLCEMYQSSFSDVPELYGHKWHSHHRVDLHQNLRELAEGPLQTDTKPAKINLGAEVVDLDCEAGRLVLADGRTSQKDVIIVANGVHSPFTSAITGEDATPSTLPPAIYRFLIPFDAFQQDQAIWALFKEEDPGFMVFNNPDTRVTIVTYPCRSNTVLNCAVFHRPLPGRENVQGWNFPVQKDELLQVLDGFNPGLQALARKADDVRLFRSRVYLDPFHRWTLGRAVLIGDAVHAMHSSMAQGGALSLEDGAALGVLLDGVGPADNIASRLQLYQRLRVERVPSIEILSNRTVRGEDDLERMRKFYQGPVPDVKARAFDKPLQEFIFPYDVFEVTARALAEMEN